MRLNPSKIYNFGLSTKTMLKIPQQARKVTFPNQAIGKLVTFPNQAIGKLVTLKPEPIDS